MRTLPVRAAIVVAGLALALPAFANYNDVTLTTDVVLSINGIEVDVNGSSALLSTITVDTGSFTVQMQPASVLVVKAPSLNILTANISGTAVGLSPVCTASVSTLEVTAPTSDTATVVITPSTSTCGSSSSSSSSSGNGPVAGGGGGGSAPTAILPTYKASTSSAPSNLPAVNSSARVLAKITATGLKKGSVSSQVKILQQMLNQDKDTQVSTSGAGSPGHETTLFGAATLVAVKKFQVKWGIAKPGDDGYGSIGPKTRAKLNLLFSK